MVLLWDQWQIYNGQKATFFPKPTVAAAPEVAGAASASVPSATAPAAAPAGPSQVPGVARLAVACGTLAGSAALTAGAVAVVGLGKKVALWPL